MIDRFTGESGRPNLIDALMQQEIVAHDKGFAERLAGKGQGAEFKPGDTIVEQNGTDTDVFFILNGEATVFVNHREVATRGPGKVVGEMVAVNPAARRSATLKAKTELTAWKLSAADFLAAGEPSAHFWKFVARMTGDRLREREKFHRPANATPIMFLGSSREGIPLAKEIESSFKHENVIVRPWYTRGVFGPSRAPVDDLIKAVDESDYAAFVFGPDDKIAYRDDEEAAVPRDNVIYEMGLFTGRLGKERVFMIMEHAADLKISTDLSGVNPVTYKCKKGCTIADVVGTVRNDIADVISKLGAI